MNNLNSNPEPTIIILNLPDPPSKKITRDYAGAYGVSINKTRIHRKNSYKPLLNLFLPYSASVANEMNMNYKVIDAQAEKYDNEETIKKIEKENPDILYTMLSLPSYKNDIKILKSINDDIFKIGCGEISKHFSNELLYNKILNLISQDYYPYVKSLKSLFVNIKNKIGYNDCEGYYYIKNGNISKCNELTYKDFNEYEMILDELTLKNYEHMYINGESILTIPILGNRGCIYSCMYCPYPNGFGNKIIILDPEKVVNEIEKLVEYGVKGILFRNQSFNTDKKWAKKVCELITQKRLDITWVAETRVDEINKEIISDMKKSGCARLHFGVETGDYSLIDIAKPGVNLDIIKKSFTNTQEHDIWAQAHILLGLPGESESSLNNTRKFINELKPDSVSINFATPYPGTPLFTYAENNNLIMTYDWDRYTSHEIVLKPKKVNPYSVLKTGKLIEKELLKTRYNTSINKGEGEKKNYLDFLAKSIIIEKKYFDKKRNI